MATTALKAHHLKNIEHYAGRLTRKDVEVMELRTYANPSPIPQRQPRERANKLVNLGLMEKYKRPRQGTLYRCTGLGMDVLITLWQRGWIEGPHPMKRG